MGVTSETPNYKLIKPDETEFYDIQVFNQNAEKIDNAIKSVNDKIPTNLPPDLSGDIEKINENLDKKLNKRTTIDTTIPASGWTGDAAPYAVNITVTQLTGAADELVEVYIPHTATLEQKTAWSEAGIVSGDNQKGVLILEALMEKPTVDIPIKLMLGGV